MVYTCMYVSTIYNKLYSRKTFTVWKVNDHLQGNIHSRSSLVIQQYVQSTYTECTCVLSVILQKTVFTDIVLSESLTGLIKPMFKIISFCGPSTSQITYDVQLCMYCVCILSYSLQLLPMGICCHTGIHFCRYAQVCVLYTPCICVIVFWYIYAHTYIPNVYVIIHDIHTMYICTCACM